MDDPNRPKFSLPELRKILQERNYLKARVSDLEDELVLYRPEKNAPFFADISIGLFKSVEMSHQAAFHCLFIFQPGFKMKFESI